MKYKSDYFKSDEYWKNNLDKMIEEDFWIESYKQYFNGGKCLDLGCGIGQYTKKLIEWDYDVTSADISDIALSKVKTFNHNIKKIDMRDDLPFDDNEFDLVFANLSIHYFSDRDTKNLMKEVKRILKPKGMFVGSVNSIREYNYLKNKMIEVEYHYWLNGNKYVRLFDEEDLKEYLSIFKIIKLEELETIRFKHKKNYFIFICQK